MMRDTITGGDTLHLQLSISGRQLNSQINDWRINLSGG